MYSRLLFLLFASITVSLLASSPVLATWKTTQFVIYQGVPVDDDPDWREEEQGEDDPSFDPAVISDIENYLSSAAKQLEKTGFPDPVAGGAMDALVTDSAGNDAIRVYLLDSDSHELATFTAPYPCNSQSTRGFIRIFTNGLTSNGKVNDQGYATLAHELFHSIQFATKFYKSIHKFPGSCKKKGQWISEGTADAIGHYMARKLRNAQFREELKGTGFFKPFGLRNYAYSLNTPKKRAAEGDSNIETYATSSFWRHLAEISYASVNGTPLSGSGPHPENYQYLAKFFKTKYKYHGTAFPTGEITWLNQTMKGESLIRGDLATIYPQFAAAFADHINTRIGPLKIATPANRQEKWLKKAFEGCSAGELSEASMKTAIMVKLRPNASRCFTVKKSGNYSAQLFIQVEDPNKALLQQLSIYMIDGTLVSKAVITDDRSPSIAKWNFPIIGTDTQTYIISNVASAPALTKPFFPLLHLSLESWGSNLTSEPSTPPPPPVKKGEPRPSNKTLLKQHVQRSIKNPEIHLERISKVKRSDYDRDTPSCDDLELRYNLCGPQLKVSLALTPFLNSIPGGNSRMDVNFLQFEDNPDLDDPTAFVGRFMSAAKKTKSTYENMDAHSIAIVLPKIDYGFTGTITNANISVSKAHGGDNDYVSQGAELQFPGRRPGTSRKIKPYTGVVSIDEYSPLTLRGSFQAELVDKSIPGNPKAPVIAKSIEGTFLSPAPWINDNNIKIDVGALQKGLVKDMLRSSGFRPDAIERISKSLGAPPESVCNKLYDKDQLKLMGYKTDCDGRPLGGGGGGGTTTTCSCDCQLLEKEKQISSCKSSCSRKWRDCPIPDGTIPDELEAQVAFYKVLLKKNKIPEAFHSKLTGPFRKASPQVREMTLESLYRKVR